MKRTLLILFALLAGAFASAGAADSGGPVKTTTLPAPDGSVVYVRYGEPGGVHIVNRFVATDSIPEPVLPSAVPVAEPIPTPETDWGALIRGLLRDELRSRPASEPAAPVEPGSTERRPTLLDAEVGRGLPSRESPAAETVSPGNEIIDARRTAPSVIVPSPAAAAVDPTPIPTPEVVRQHILDDGLFRTNLVLFETSRADLLPRSQDVLRVIGDVLRELPDAQVRVEGHADRRGPDDFNLALSQGRAEAVRDFLLDCCGLQADHIVAKGYGESRPIASGESPTALALNRRVEFRILNPETLRR